MTKILGEETNAVISGVEEEVTPVRPVVNLIDVLLEQGGLTHVLPLTTVNLTARQLEGPT